MEYKRRLAFLFFLFIFVRHFFILKTMETCQYYVKYSALLAYSSIIGLYLSSELSNFKILKPISHCLLWLSFSMMVLSLPALLVVLSLNLANGGQYCYDFFWVDFALSILVNLCIIMLSIIGVLFACKQVERHKSAKKASQTLLGLFKIARNPGPATLEFVINNYEAITKQKWSREFVIFLNDGFGKVQEKHAVDSLASLENYTSLGISSISGTSTQSAECPICLELIKPGSQAITHPGCGHLFHEPCITSWLLPQTSRQDGPSKATPKRVSCPMCRKNTMVEFFIESNRKAFLEARKSKLSQKSKISEEPNAEELLCEQLVSKIRALESSGKH